MTTETNKTITAPHDLLAEDEIMISINLYFKTKPQDDENSSITFSDASISGAKVTPEGAHTILKGVGFANIDGTALEQITAIACDAAAGNSEGVVDLG